MKRKLCSFGLTLFFFSFLVGANASSYEINEESDTHVLTEHSTFYIDSLGEFTFSEAVNNDSQFSTFGNDDPINNIGLVNYPVWFKVDVENNLNTTQTFFVIAGRHHIDSLEFAIVKDDSIRFHHESGDHYPFNNRLIEHSDFVYQVSLEPNEKATLIYRIRTKGNIAFSPILYSNNAFIKHEQGENLFYGIYFGVLLIIIVFSFIVYFSTRDNSYLHYLLYIITFGLFLFAWNGLGFQYIWSESTWFQNRAITLLTFFWIFFAFLFTNSFLNLKRELPFFHKALKVLLVITIAFILLVPVSLDAMIKVAPLYVILASVFMLIIAVKSTMKGNLSARFYLLAWSLFLTAFILTALIVMGVKLPLFINENTLYWGSGLEMILLSFAIGEKIRTITRQNDEAQKKVLVQLEEMNKMKDDINIRLEEQVEQRTQQVNKQNELLSEKNKNITDSINYAKKIQDSILPSDEELKSVFPNSFILYKPKDIVAGDFYWMRKFDEKIIFAVADCTGHGVPGALVSVVCNNALNRSVKEYNLSSPEEILDKARDLIIEAFGTKKGEIKDGMDISLCTYDLKKKVIEFSGANNPLWILRKDCVEIEEIKGDKQPVGRYVDMQPFKKHRLNVDKGDQIVLFSDGYADQFGGKKGKKYKYKQLKSLMLDLRNRPLTMQGNMLNDAFEKWQGGFEQVDDVCVIGIRI